MSSIKTIRAELESFAVEHKLNNFVPLLLVTSSANSLTKAITDGLIMPLFNLIIPHGDWTNATFTLFKLQIGWGSVVSALINFLLICVLAYTIMRIKPVIKISKDKKYLKSPTR